MASGHRDYSHRSRLEKLGATAGMKVALIGRFDEDFVEELAAAVGSLRRRAAGCDLVFLAVEKREDLDRLPRLEAGIARNGAIWAVHPKGRKDLRDVDVIDAAKEAGLVDNKVVGFSNTHSALRLVVPKARR